MISRGNELSHDIHKQHCWVSWTHSTMEALDTDRFLNFQIALIFFFLKWPHTGAPYKISTCEIRVSQDKKRKRKTGTVIREKMSKFHWKNVDVLNTYVPHCILKLKLFVCWEVVLCVSCFFIIMIWKTFTKSVFATQLWFSPDACHNIGGNYWWWALSTKYQVFKQAQRNQYQAFCVCFTSFWWHNTHFIGTQL